ncbi:class I SAM-dependent methyltransferase [soil metagenome]
MSVDQDITRHYEHGALEKALLDALTANGKDPDRLTAADLAPVDEFHIGGRQATLELGAQLDLPRGARVLDVGSGIGGPSRAFAQEHGWQVDGIDLTPEYVEVAERLSRRVGLDASVTYRQASALALPFADATFDGAYMLHVGMNIADKQAAFADIHRVLKRGGVFAIYDVMRESDGDFVYPVPWSSAPETNFIDSAAAYKRQLTEAGFSVLSERSRRDFALQFFRQMRQRMAQGGPAAPGLQIVMGATAPQKVANMTAMLERGVFAPTEIISRAT